MRPDVFPPNLPLVETIDILGTSLAVTDYDEFTRFCHELARRDQTYAVDLTNTHVVTMRRHDRHFREITSRFDYFLPDGMPLIWCMNARGAHLRDRVYGPTFTRHCITNSPAPVTHYLLGGSTECLARLKERLLATNPNIQFVGAHHGYFEPADEPKILQEINALSPDFIWVGLGTPKQQDWIHRNKAAVNRGVLFAVGFAFDVNAGMKPDAPLWMQNAGLTWIYRIVSEPRRLLGRYVRYNSLFLFYLLRDAIFGSRAPTTSS